MNLNEGYEILICEGEFDTMGAEQQRYKAIGIPGVHNYPDDIKEILKNYEPVICFDNDEAGRKGMQNITNIIGKRTLGLYLTEHNDITEYFKKQGIRIREK